MFGSLIAMMAAGLAAATDGSAVQQPPPETPAPVTVTAPKAKDPLDEITCRYMDQTGTRLGGGKVCHTRRDWAEYTRASRETVEHAQRNGGMGRLPATPGD
jgi:hypothetical protein